MGEALHNINLRHTAKAVATLCLTTCTVLAVRLVWPRALRVRQWAVTTVAMPRMLVSIANQLGFTGGTQHQSATHGQGSGNIMYDDVHCTGNEANLASCPRGTVTHNCGHHEDAGVTCTV